MRILVVEDLKDSAETLALMLRLSGYEVTVAPDGPTALRAAEQEQPDVILLDIGLPGMSGHEVAKRLKEKTAGKPAFLIAVTGLGRGEDRQRSKEAGIDIHLVKPVEPEQLEHLLKKFHRIIG
jgi:CheY-like chemotaxis protein